MRDAPPDLPRVTYLPHRWAHLERSPVNELLADLRVDSQSLDSIAAAQPLDVSPCFDDSPYFYRIEKGIPRGLLQLFGATLVGAVAVLGVPRIHRRRRVGGKTRATPESPTAPLIVFGCLGFGFMVLQVSLFQKLVLYLGSPTLSLAILLAALLVGMGFGSMLGARVVRSSHQRRLIAVSVWIVLGGFVLIIALPPILNALMGVATAYRAMTTILLVAPFGFLLGIPFPTAIQVLRDRSMEELIPWMYGVNGALSVAGSVGAVLASMYFGFTPAFLLGLCFYGAIGVTAWSVSKRESGRLHPSTIF
jgi:hypothetical protein